MQKLLMLCEVFSNKPLFLLVQQSHTSQCSSVYELAKHPIHPPLLHLVPSAPRSPMVIRATPNTYELSWIPPQEPHGAVRYTVKYTNTQNRTEGQINTAGEHCNLTGITPGVTYHIAVAAMNSVGVGAESEGVVFTATQSGTPPTLGTGEKMEAKQ